VRVSPVEAKVIVPDVAPLVRFKLAQLDHLDYSISCIILISGGSREALSAIALIS